MKIRALTFSFVIASFLMFGCAANPTALPIAPSDIPPTDIPTEAMVQVTDTSVPLSFEAENLFSFNEMGISIGFNFPEGFNQSTNTNVIAVQELHAPYELPYPQHARILFTAYSSGVEDNVAPGIRVFRLSEIDSLEAGISENVSAVLAGQTDHRTDFPRLAGAGSPDGQVAIINFQNGTGYRYVIGTRGFAASSLRGTGATYMYQGITNDGKYFISVVLAVNLPFLADLVGVPLNTAEEADAYFRTVDERTNTANPTDFVPSLEMLDELISSIVVIEK